MNPYYEIGGRCIQCDNCRSICPESSILIEAGEYSIETWTCTLCSLCVQVCPVNCIKLIEENKQIS